MNRLATTADAPERRRARGRGRPTTGESEALYLAIVAAAVTEFECHGFELANVSAIARAGGATKATIYRLFGSKEQLFKVAIREALGRVRTPSRGFDVLRPPEVVLHDAANEIATSYLTGSAGALWHSVLAERKRFPDFYEEVKELLRQETIASSLARYLAAMGELGILDVPDPLMTAHHFSLLIGQGRELALPPKAGDAQESDRVGQIVRMFISGHAPGTHRQTSKVASRPPVPIPVPVPIESELER
jgi:TetR/AcrR family transcriptional repressor of mexJK operon